MKRENQVLVKKMIAKKIFCCTTKYLDNNSYHHNYLYEQGVRKYFI